MGTRPKLKIPLSNGDIVIEALGWLTVIAFWLLAMFVYPILPETIPTHFGISGAANAFGPKSGLFFLPGIATFLFIVISVLNHFPHTFNYPGVINETNALKQYTYSTRLLRFLKFSVTLIFLTIFTMASLTALHKASGLGYWFLPATLAFIFTPIIIYIFKSKEVT